MRPTPHPGRCPGLSHRAPSGLPRRPPATLVRAWFACSETSSDWNRICLSYFTHREARPAQRRSAKEDKQMRADDSAHRPSGEWITPTLTIPDLLRSAPEARPVLDRYGLRGCGGRLGPTESLDFFARAHDVPLERLLRELREQVGRPAGTPGEGEARPEDAIYRRFFKAGILVVLTLGAGWGAYLLLRIAAGGSFRAAGLHEVNAHGHAQIFGWVGLFVMGFAYQAFPRFKHTSLAYPRLAFASLWLMLAGLVARSVLQPLAAPPPPLAAAAVAASGLEVAAAAIFVWVVLATWRGAGKPLAVLDYYILSALVWFLLQAVYESVYLAATL